MIQWLTSLFSVFNKAKAFWSPVDYGQAFICIAICMACIAAIVVLVYMVAKFVNRIKNRFEKLGNKPFEDVRQRKTK